MYLIFITLWNLIAEGNHLTWVKEYLERPKEDVSRDHQLVKKVVDKLNPKEWKYSFSKNKNEKDLIEKSFFDFINQSIVSFCSLVF